MIERRGAEGSRGELVVVLEVNMAAMRALCVSLRVVAILPWSGIAAPSEWFTTVFALPASFFLPVQDVNKFAVFKNESISTG